ncbi:MAG TPA: hypothetical protein VH855_24495 [Acetobacteraceae bacterium]
MVTWARGDALHEPSSRVLLVGGASQIAEALSGVFGQHYDIVQAADSDDALRLIAEEGADVLLLSQAMFFAERPATGRAEVDPEAVRIIGELLKALDKKRKESNSGSV